jgi:hypothetical protein
MVQVEATCFGAVIAREERHQASVQTERRPVGERRQRGPVGVEYQLSGAQLANRTIRHIERRYYGCDDRCHGAPHTTRVAARMSAISGPGR